MEKVRAKFLCTSMKQTQQYKGTIVNTYEFGAVYGGGSASDENKKYWEATPSGSIMLSCLRSEVQFEIGKEYYIDFLLVPEVVEVVKEEVRVEASPQEEISGPIKLGDSL